MYYLHLWAGGILFAKVSMVRDRRENLIAKSEDLVLDGSTVQCCLSKNTLEQVLLAVEGFYITVCIYQYEESIHYLLALRTRKN